MNLLNFLMDSMSSDSSVDALAKKSGTTKKQTSSLLSLALPILIKYLTQNASSQGGALSLSNALTQHTDTSSMMQQFSNADQQDGNAIISHILGSDSGNVVNSLAQQTGMGNDQVISLLGNMAPGMMSGLSAATTSAQQNQQQAGSFDFTDLMGAFGGASAAPSAGGFGSLFGSLFGGGGSNAGTLNSSNDGTDLLSSLLGMLK